MQTTIQRRLDWGSRMDMGDVFGDPRLAGFEIAAVDAGQRGVTVRYWAKIDEEPTVDIESTVPYQSGL